MHSYQANTYYEAYEADTDMLVSLCERLLGVKSTLLDARRERSVGAGELPTMLEGVRLVRPEARA
jgi:hypothetical protein